MYTIWRSIVVSTLVCHAGIPGSIPGARAFLCAATPRHTSCTATSPTHPSCTHPVPCTPCPWPPRPPRSSRHADLGVATPAPTRTSPAGCTLLTHAVRLVDTAWRCRHAPSCSVEAPAARGNGCTGRGSDNDQHANTPTRQRLQQPHCVLPPCRQPWGGCQGCCVAPFPRHGLLGVHASAWGGQSWPWWR